MLRKGGTSGSDGVGRIASAYAEMPNGVGAQMYYEVSPDQGITERMLSTLSIASITMRCTELTKLLRTTHTLELRQVYSLLLKHIFGWEHLSGWRLRSLKRDLSPLETEEILKFLRPEGPLLELTYRLMGDPNLLYDFPAAALPVGLQHKLTSNDLPSYIANNLPDRIYAAQSSTGYNLLLNPFELFFFHYTYAEIRQNLESTSPFLGLALNSNITDSIYSDLLQEYLNYFVPTTDDYQIPTPLSKMVYNTSPAKPNYMIGQGQQQSKANNLTIDENMTLDPPTIFKASVFQSDALYHEPAHLTIHKNPSMDSEFWRTEAFLNILIFMWLSVEEDDVGYKFGTILPTVELVKSVRIVVRHWHLFSNIVNRTMNHPVEELRRNVFPLFQKKLYQFLRYIFPRWPLDTSFRIVYETWLSYIQPWRYSQAASLRSGTDGVGESSQQPWNLDASQCNFVLENLPFYTSLFQHILTRMSRADFSSLRNTHMLYRITKIYCGIENLRTVLYEIEKKILSDPALEASSFKWHFGEELSSPLIEPSSFFPASFNGGFSSSSIQAYVPSSLKIAAVKQMMAEMDGEDLHYVPLFSKVNKEKVAQLMETIGQMLKLCEEPLPTPPQIEEPRNDWWSRIVRIFVSSPAPANQSAQDYNSQLEIAKRIQFLNMSRTNLARLFNLQYPVEYGNPLRAGSEFGGQFGFARNDREQDNSMNSNNSFGQDETEFGGSSGVAFIPRGSIPGGYLDLHNGNPDTSCPSSNEIRIVVEITKWISAYLNQFISPWAEGLYFKETLRSRLCRAILARPAHYYELKKLRPGSSIREKKYLPPRLNLRFLASSSMPYFLMAYALACWFFGIQGFNILLVPFIFIIIYILMRAALEPKYFLSKVQYEFGQELRIRKKFPSKGKESPQSSPTMDPKSKG